jgi:hypothetical protein
MDGASLGSVEQTSPTLFKAQPPASHRVQLENIAPKWFCRDPGAVMALWHSLRSFGLAQADEFIYFTWITRWRIQFW